MASRWTTTSVATSDWFPGGEKAAFLGVGTYAVYPLAPDVVMYCYPDEDPWREKGIARFDCTISPVTFTDELVDSENMAHVFMASRFVFSNRPVFDDEREFAKTVGTDTYAPPGTRLFDTEDS